MCNTAESLTISRSVFGGSAASCVLTAVGFFGIGGPGGSSHHSNLTLTIGFTVAIVVGGVLGGLYGYCRHRPNPIAPVANNQHGVPLLPNAIP